MNYLSYTYRIFRLAGIWVLAGTLAGGCTQMDQELDSQKDLLPHVQENKGEPIEFKVRSGDHIGAQVMAFADSHLARVTQIYQDIEQNTTDFEVGKWARREKIANANATLAIATGANPVVNLLDIVVMVSLKHASMEEGGVAVQAGAMSEKLLEAYQKSKEAGWKLVEMNFTPEQVVELQSLIDQYRLENPDLRSVGFVRLQEFSAYRMSVQSDSVKPGSLFSLLRMDPFSGLDPMNYEIGQVRRQAERVIYYSQRAPMLVQWQVQDALLSTLESPEVRQVAKSTEVFSQAADRMVGETADLPGEITREREAALMQIDQLIEKQRGKTLSESEEMIDRERAAIVKQADDMRGSLNEDVKQHINHVSTLLGDVEKTVDKMGIIAKTTTASANATVNATHQIAKDLIDRLFLRLLILIVVVIAGIPIARRLGWRK